MTTALTRPVSATIGACELTHIERTDIDVPLARSQHAAYVSALRAAGCGIHELPPADDLPDSVFVEDTAIALPEIALIARPGAASRRPETEAVAGALAGYLPLATIEAPGTLDGGDVLRVGRTLFVGRSQRTNGAAVEQLRALLTGYGYTITPVPVTACLHLKTAVTAVSDDTLLVNSEWIDPGLLAGFRLMEVDRSEPFAANVLRVGDHLLAAAAFPRTNEKLRRLGVHVVEVDVSELARAEGALTCCSVLIET